MKSPWEILGVVRGSSEEDIRKAFREKARKLHPDKGGSASEFRELYDAYNTLKDPSYVDDKSDDEWLGWLGRWAKRFIGTEEKILNIKVPYKLLEDRDQSIQLEYDGLPVVVDLNYTEKVTFGGVRIRLIPHAFVKFDLSGEEMPIKEDPWRKDKEWLFMVPENVVCFKINGGEWKQEDGEYMSGVYWKRL